MKTSAAKNTLKPTTTKNNQIFKKYTKLLVLSFTLFRSNEDINGTMRAS